MMKKNVLNASILAALGLGMAGVANATVIGTPVVLDSQVTQADGDFAADAPGTTILNTAFTDLNLGTIDNRNFTLVFQLGQGARFETGSTLTLVCSGSSGVFSGAKTLFAGGASASSATYVLDASGLNSQGAISHCTLTVSGAGGTGGITLNSGSNNSSVTVTVSGNGLLVGTPVGFSTAGAIMTAAQGVNATAIAGLTAVLDVVSGYVNFISANNSTDASGDMDAFLGYVQYVATTATRTLVSAAATASDVASSGSITVGGTFVAGISNVTGAYIFQAATGVATPSATVCSAAAAGNVTGTMNTAAGTVTFNVTSTMIGDGTSGSPVSGVVLCAHVPGSTRMTPGTVTVSFSATSKTGYTANTATSNSDLAVVGKNGVTRTAWNVPAPSSSDQAYIRVYNTSSLAGKVTGTLYGQDGTALCSNVTLITSLASMAVDILDVNDIATACGVSSWTGRAYLVMDGEMPTMVVTPLVRASGVLTNMSPIATQ